MLGINLELVIGICIQVAIVMVATVFHEMAHAAAANALGDPTAKENGRLTLNPFAHLDLVGSFVLPLLMAALGGPIFAFAKPVPYNPNRLRNPIRDEVLVALAGPACNLVQAAIGAIAFRVCLATLPLDAMASIVVLDTLSKYVYINLMLMFFNLIPLPPLDGSSIISPLLRGKAREAYYTIQRNAMPVLLGIIYVVPWLFHVNPISMYIQATAGPFANALLGF